MGCDGHAAASAGIGLITDQPGARRTSPEQEQEARSVSLAPSGSATRELKEISVIFPKTQVTDLLGALIE